MIRRRFNPFVVLLAALFIGGCAATKGCEGGSGWFKPPGATTNTHPDDKDSTATQRDKARAKLDAAANAVGWLGGICLLASLGTLVASFVVPIIPRKAAIGCLIGGVACYALQYALLVYGVYFAEVAVWLSIALCGLMGGTTLWPWVVTLKNRALAKTGQALIEKGHLPEAVAVLAEAKPGELGTPESRKALLATLTGAEKGPDK